MMGVVLSDLLETNESRSYISSEYECAHRHMVKKILKKFKKGIDKDKKIVYNKNTK